MGYSEQTPNYDLPLYLADDRPSYLGDWNETMNTIDKGMNDNKNGISDANTSISNLKTYVDNTTEQLESTLTESMNNLKTEVDNAVDTVNENISELQESHNMVFFGDSWIKTNAGDTEFVTRLASLMSLSYKNFGVSGATIKPGNNDLTAQIENMNSDDSFNKDKTSLAVILMGINDYRAGTSVDDLLSTLHESGSAIKSALPNAKIIFAINTQFPYTSDLSDWCATLSQRLLTSKTFNSVFNGDGLFTSQYFNDTNFHLTNNGYYAFASMISSAIFGGTKRSIILSYSANSGNSSANVTFEKMANMVLVSLDINISSQEKNTVFNFTNLPWANDLAGLQGVISRSFTPILLQFSGSNLTVASQQALTQTTKIHYLFAVNFGLVS